MWGGGDVIRIFKKNIPSSLVSRYQNFDGEFDTKRIIRVQDRKTEKREIRKHVSPWSKGKRKAQTTQMEENKLTWPVSRALSEWGKGLDRERVGGQKGDSLPIGEK